MLINPKTIRRTRNEIKMGNFSGATFEEFCISLFKRTKKYKNIRSDNISITGNAQSKVPDAYIYHASRGTYTVFEFTENKRLGEYIHGSMGLLNRQYLHDFGGSIVNFVLVTSQVVEDRKKRQYKSVIAEKYNCTCEIKDNEDISNMLFDGKLDLIKHYFDIDICPKNFITVNDAIERFSGTISCFPVFDSFDKEELSFSKDVEARITEITSDPHISLLLYGKWGTGKTVLSLLTGVKLGKKGYTCYYINLLERCIDDEEHFANSLIYNSIAQFADEKVVFIIDNAHAMPIAAYRISSYMKKEKHNIILTSRLMPRETSDEIYDYVDLFSATSPVGCRMVCLSISERFVLDAFIAYVNKRIGAIDQEDLKGIFKTVGPNLTLLLLYLEIRVKQPKADPKKEIYNLLNTKYTLSHYQEWYIVAALSSLDCPVDLRAAIPDSTRRGEFVRHLNSKNRGVVLSNYDYVVGMSAAEGRLICEAAFDACETFSFMPESHTLVGVDDIINVLTIYYAENRPHNPYRLMKSIWWSAFEAKEQHDFYSDEKLTNLLVDLFNSRNFVSYLRHVCSRRLSILALGGLFRLISYSKIPVRAGREILDHKSLDKGMISLQTKLACENKELTFTWREYFAWKHVKNVDVDTANKFLTYYSDEVLVRYGRASVKQLSNLLYMALTSHRVRVLIHKNIEQILNYDLLHMIGNCNEVTLVFLYRNAALVGEATRKRLCNCIPPNLLGQAARQFNKLSGAIFYTVYKATFPAYSSEFISTFDREEIYRCLYLGPLERISWYYENPMFKRFLKYDFTPAFFSSDMKQIQLFLRNILRHGFGAEHRMLVRDKVKQKPFFNYVLKKFGDQSTDLRDINYFISNYWILDPDTAKVFFNILFEKVEEWGLLQRGTLADLGIFLFNSYIMTGKKDPPLEHNKLRQYILQKTASITTYDLLVLGGYLNITKSSFKFTIIFDDRVDSVIKFFDRYRPVFEDDEDIHVITNYMLRYSCLVNGIYYYGYNVHNVYQTADIKEIATKLKEVIDVVQDESESSTKYIRKRILSDALGKFNVSEEDAELGADALFLPA